MAKPHPGRRHGTDWVPIDQPARSQAEAKPSVVPEPIEATPLPKRPTLAQCEEAIDRSFVVQGQALRYVRELKLYREAGYETFEDWCQTRWKFTRQHVNDLIRGAEVVLGLETMVSKLSPEERPPLPANERQTRALGKYPEERRPEVMRLAAKAGGGKVTAATIVQAGSLLGLGELPKVEPPIEVEAIQEASAPIYAKCDSCGIELRTQASRAGSSMIGGDLLCARCVSGEAPVVEAEPVAESPEPTSVICPTCHGKGAISRQKSDALDAQ